jgi:hypothetical protein
MEKKSHFINGFKIKCDSQNLDKQFLSSGKNNCSQRCAVVQTCAADTFGERELVRKNF